jgi:elongation factor G
MTTKAGSAPRCAAIVGPYLSGKTTVLEGLLFTAGAVHRRGTIAEGNTVGDASPEARGRQMSVEANFAHCDYLGDHWSFVDCPGSVELAEEARNALLGADVAVVVAEPEPERAATLSPVLKFLADYGIPHMVFVNKMDKATGRVADLLQAFQGVSAKPLVLRQVPIRDEEAVTGFVDLASERAYQYSPGDHSKLIEMPESVHDRESAARQEMLESLADFDDALLEQLLEDKVPAPDAIYDQLTKDLAGGLIVPVFLGAAEQGSGLTRLFKALRHEAPTPQETAARLGIPEGEGLAASVVKTINQSHTGKLSVARIWRGQVKDGMSIGGHRLSGLYRLMGQENQKIGEAGEGDLVALGRLDELSTGAFVTEAGKTEAPDLIWPTPPMPVYALAISPENRQDEVKLTSSIAKLIEEDPSLSLEHNADTHQMLLWGQGEIQLKIALEKLKSRYNVGVTAEPPMTAYKETIRKTVQQHSRFKRQTGGHGQFGDVHVTVKPQPRGAGFEFADRIVGGAIPKQYIPAVENGVKEYLERGPLGFPVVDIAVELYDGQYHSVDSSDMAFKTAGRLAMSEALPQCNPILLEPILQVTMVVPSEYTSKLHAVISSRRGQILGFEPKAGWDGWDELKAYMPQSEVHDLIVEIRSLTLGVGTFEWVFDHLQELSGRLADKVVETRKAQLEG